jgi:hypothetical protein
VVPDISGVKIALSTFSLYFCGNFRQTAIKFALGFVQVNQC